MVYSYGDMELGEDRGKMPADVDFCCRDGSS